MRRVFIIIYLTQLALVRIFTDKSIFFIDIIVGTIILIFMYLIVKKYTVKRMLKYKMENVDKLSGEDFEEFLALKFKKLGYKVKLTPTTADYGADLVLKKDKAKIVVQAKRWNSKVGVEAVQQVVASMKYYNADRSMVITNSYFTDNAKILAKYNEVELYDRSRLYNLLEAQNTNEMFNKSVCPKCGADLVIRNGKYGYFYGCESYPKCSFTKNIEGSNNNHNVK
nr:restriction endonuclease [Clostridium yunnanense]